MGFVPPPSARGSDRPARHPLVLRAANARLHIPDAAPLPRALSRTTHLGVGAHADDLEFMALHGILACHGSRHRWFGGVTCTDGAGSVRGGPVARLSRERLRTARRREQDRAADLGGYGAMIQLGYGSVDAAGARNADLEADLADILRATRPRVVYTHNLADKHPTHLVVALALIRAIRGLPTEWRPRRVLGCEGWRGLDWMPDSEKIRLDVSRPPRLGRDLTAVFKTQIAGGKRYDRAVEGRRHANATFLDPHRADPAEQLVFAMDLTPLARDARLDPARYTLACIDRFRAEVRAALTQVRNPR